MISKLESSWHESIGGEFEKPYFRKLQKFLKKEKGEGKTIFPPEDQIFHALNILPLKKVKVVILGQDPYPSPNHAHGLSFSVTKGTKLPRSLQNIYKELKADLGIPIRENGDLTHWAKQGVLLLNAVLTVEKSNARSHKSKGWEKFTDTVIKTISKENKYVVFILWGKDAREKVGIIDSRHGIIESPHPSPQSAYTGFMESKPFSRTNTKLRNNNLTEIQW